MPGALSPEQIAAAASVVAAGGAVAIPLVLAWLGAAVKRRDDRKAEVFAMRDFSAQWQDYNLALATSPDAAAYLHDTDFTVKEDGKDRRLSVSEIRTIHFIFFELTAMYQCYYAVRRGVEPEGWAARIVADIAPTIANDDLLKIALKDRGYDKEFCDYIMTVRARKTPSRIEPDQGKRWFHYPGSYVILGLALLVGVLTGLGLWLSLDHDRDVANDRRCTMIQQDMLSAQPRRADGPELFQALGCRPRGFGGPRSGAH